MPKKRPNEGNPGFKRVCRVVTNIAKKLLKVTDAAKTVSGTVQAFWLATRAVRKMTQGSATSGTSEPAALVPQAIRLPPKPHPVSTCVSQACGLPPLTRAQAGGGVATDPVPRAGSGVIATVSADSLPTMTLDAIETRVRQLFTDFGPTGPKAVPYGLVYMTFHTTNTGLPTTVNHKGMRFRFLPRGKLLVLVRCCKPGAVESLLGYISSLLSNEFQINSVDGSPGLQGDVHIPFKEVETCLGPNLAKYGFRKRALTLGSCVFTDGESSILVSGMDETITRVCVVTNGMLKKPVEILNARWKYIGTILRDRSSAGAAQAAQNTDHQCTQECMKDPMTPPASEEEESACTMAAHALALMADQQTNMQEVD